MISPTIYRVKKALRQIPILFMAFALSACGGGGSGSPGAASPFSAGASWVRNDSGIVLASNSGGTIGSATSAATYIYDGTRIPQNSSAVSTQEQSVRASSGTTSVDLPGSPGWTLIKTANVTRWIKAPNNDYSITTVSTVTSYTGCGLCGVGSNVNAIIQETTTITGMINGSVYSPPSVNVVELYQAFTRQL